MRICAFAFLVFVFGFFFCISFVLVENHNDNWRTVFSISYFVYDVYPIMGGWWRALFYSQIFDLSCQDYCIGWFWCGVLLCVYCVFSGHEGKHRRVQRLGRRPARRLPGEDEGRGQDQRGRKRQRRLWRRERWVEPLIECHAGARTRNPRRRVLTRDCVFAPRRRVVQPRRGGGRHRRRVSEAFHIASNERLARLLFTQLTSSLLYPPLHPQGTTATPRPATAATRATTARTTPPRRRRPKKSKWWRRRKKESRARR